MQRLAIKEQALIITFPRVGFSRECIGGVGSALVMSMNLERMSNVVSLIREMMGFLTHDFDIFQSVFSCWYRISLRVDMGHVAPILDGIRGGARWNVGIAEDEAKDVSAIDDGVEISDVGFVWRIPRAIEASALLLHTRESCKRSIEGKVSEINYGPEGNEKEESSGIGVRRHGSYISSGIQGSVDRLVSQERQLDCQH